jgi:hypothetical protein
VNKTGMAYASWSKRPANCGETGYHRLGCECKGCHCSRCNKELYFSQTANCYGCRSSDCPPGAQRRADIDLNKGVKLLAILRKFPPSRFASVNDLAYVISLCDDSDHFPSGRRLASIRGRIREEEPK